MTKNTNCSRWVAAVTVVLALVLGELLTIPEVWADGATPLQSMITWNGWAYGTYGGKTWDCTYMSDPLSAYQCSSDYWSYVQTHNGDDPGGYTYSNLACGTWNGTSPYVTCTANVQGCIRANPPSQCYNTTESRDVYHNPPTNSCPPNSTISSSSCICNSGYAPSHDPDPSKACAPVVEIDKTRKPGACSRKKPGFGDPLYPLAGGEIYPVDLGVRLAGEAWTVTYDTSIAMQRAQLSVSAGSSSALGTDEVFYDTPVLGALWHSSLHRQLTIDANGMVISAGRGDGRVVSFTSSTPFGSFTPDADINDQVSRTASGYLYKEMAGGAEETYDTSGHLQQLAYLDGRTVSLTFSDSATPAAIAPGPGYLIAARDQFARRVSLQYDETGKLSQITAPGQRQIVPSYSGNILTAFNWQADGTSVQFLHENANVSSAITGIIDEKGQRYATIGYSDTGVGGFTQLAGGVNKYSVTYDTPPATSISDAYDDGTNTVYRTRTPIAPTGVVLTLPNGTTSNLGIAPGQLDTYLASQSQTAGSGCAASTSQQSYDANGNATQQDDFDGHRACYAYDTSRNLETTRVEGLSTSASCASLLPNGSALPTASRKTSTQWHPDWRLATKVAEPGKLTTNVYNGQPDPFNGGATASCAPGTALLPDGKPVVVLCKKVEQATTDADGSQGFSAALDTKVPNRVWSYTYNQYGQVLTAKGPRTDVNDTTTYAYYSDTTSSHTLGDLQTVTDPLGHVTTYTQYDAYGNVLEQVDANQVTTDYSYDARQRLKTVKVGSQTTSYDYWPTGLLKQVTWPDLSYVAYSYDDAHRLTDVSDSQGNSVHYVLDNAGNREAEQYKDPTGTLKRELDRAYDALGRVQQTTGRE